MQYIFRGWTYLLRPTIGQFEAEVQAIASLPERSTHMSRSFKVRISLGKAGVHMPPQFANHSDPEAVLYTPMF
jgi:hypothetical protein